jgi:hypothetical protein
MMIDPGGRRIALTSEDRDPFLEISTIGLGGRA